MAKALRMNGSAALAVAIMAAIEPTIVTTNSFNALGKAMRSVHISGDLTWSSKGKRSKRRRAAKMRTAGYKHYDGVGWGHPDEIQRLRDIANRAIEAYRPETTT